MRLTGFWRVAIAVVLVVAMMCSTGVTVMASEIEDDYVISSGYNPFATENDSGNNRSIIGGDERETINNTKAFPYSAIAYLQILYGCACAAEGTGFMVSQNCMLTAGHCLVCTTHGKPAGLIIARFGYASDDDFLVSVTATPNNSIIYHDPKYTGSEIDYDYGYVVFSTNVGETTGWFGLAARNDSLLKGSDITVTGYEDRTLKEGTGEITAVTATRVKYNADTKPGESGGPVYYYSSVYGYVAVAIHTQGTDLFNWKNSGGRITSDFINYLADQGYITKTIIGNGGRSLTDTVD